MDSKKASDLQPGDRIQFTNKDLIFRATEAYQPLAAEVIRTIPVFGNDRMMIMTSAGNMIPVEPEKEFPLVEGDFDPGAAPMVYPPEVKVAEVVDGRSIE